MYKLFLTTLFTALIATLSNADNPKPYAVLGNVIYDNIENIASLKEIQSYKLYKDEIDTYTQEVAQAKELGYKVEKSTVSTEKREYLNKLRTLSKTNDYYLRSINSHYKESMSKKNYKLFSQIINTGLIDTQKNKKEIIDYYYKNKEYIDSKGVIDAFLEEDTRLRARKEAQKKYYKTKQQLEEEKIKRIRSQDKREQKRLEEALQKDLNTKKAEIRKTQRRELSN
ncbi:hypothetical protein JHD46_01050 [Sulfurimonas sp. SAG-AH-194-C20]|nr:hypothetical protein [Sulfurimonas sp. SAG-AH-194-C20]MDF1878219.1 hypothetical protein [Sulfurimonas sp. SAG-AH-194-C20]